MKKTRNSSQSHHGTYLVFLQATIKCSCSHFLPLRNFIHYLSKVTLYTDIALGLIGIKTVINSFLLILSADSESLISRTIFLS